jgi:hypothetical protein
MKTPRLWSTIILILICPLYLLTSCASPPAGRPRIAPTGAQEPTPSASATIEVILPSSPTSTAATTPSPDIVYPSSGGGCPPFSNARLQLNLNDLNQVMVHWQVEGGCPPYSGTLTAWYQDEFHPSAIYTITEVTGSQLDSPVLHRGSWDRDYYLTLMDAAGQRIELARTIAVGR